MSLPPSYNLLAKYPNKYFVETGTFRGDAILQAQEAGFKHIRSIDLDFKEFYNSPNKALIGIVEVKLYTGNSAEMLWDMIKDIEEPITFWLDAHHQLLEGEPLGNNPFPLKKEIQQIARHRIKTHTIIVDDLLQMTNPLLTDFSYQELVYMIKEINWKYKFELIANPIIKNILIAHL